MEIFRESKALYDKVKSICPGGVHSSVRFETEIGHPIYFSRARGSKIWDLDGTEFIDCIIGYGAILLGHNDPEVAEAVKEAIDVGLTVGAETELSYTVAKKLVDMIPCAESIKFSVTGTEAVMHAIHVVRGYTGRDLIMKLEGSYGGWCDSVLVSNNPPKYAWGPVREPNVHRESAGILKEATTKTIVYPFNNRDVFSNLVNKYKEDLAGVIITPVVYSHGVITPEGGYLEAVREITQENDVPLIFDEVISGFRCAPGGAQELYGVTPDLTVFGKAVANGYPLSGVVGKEEIMKVTAPGAEVGWQGTHNGNQIALAAASACLDQLKGGTVQTYIRNGAERLVKKFNQVCEERKIGYMVTSGGLFSPYFTKKRISDHRDRASDKKMFMAFWNELIKNRILARPEHLAWHGLTSAHSREDIEKIELAIDSGATKANELQD